jgi:hypothetical protein
VYDIIDKNAEIDMPHNELLYRLEPRRGKRIIKEDNMKKLLAIFLTLALSLSVIACGDDDDDKGDGNPPTVTPGGDGGGNLPGLPGDGVDLPDYPLEWN